MGLWVLYLLIALLLAGCPESPGGEVNSGAADASGGDGQDVSLAVVASTATSTFTSAPPPETVAPPAATPVATDTETPPLPETTLPRFIPAPTATPTAPSTSPPIATPVVETAAEAAAAASGDFANSESGVLSYMCDCLHGNATASGERYDKDAFVAAHKSLPFGTQVRVTNLTNGLTADVVIVDRLPHNNPHMIDVSSVAARQLKLTSAGNADAIIEWN